MPPISVEKLDVSKLTFSNPYNAKFGTKLYYISHKQKFLKIQSPTTATPFGISQYNSTSDMRIKLQLDPSDNSHREFIQALRNIEHEARDHLTSNKPFKSLVNADNRGNLCVELSLNCKNIEAFEGTIYDVESKKYTETVRARSKVNCVFHVKHMYEQSESSGIKLVAQKINIEERPFYPSDLTQFAFREE